MLQSMKIQNYRGFRRLEMDDIGAVNLIVGKNNSGKTSLLEAIYLLSGGGDALSAVNPTILRLPHSKIIHEQQAIQALEPYFEQLFHDHNMEKPIEIEANLGHQGNARLKISLEERQETHIPWVVDGPMTTSIFHKHCIKAELFRHNLLQPDASSRLWFKDGQLQRYPPEGVPSLFSWSFNLNRGNRDNPEYARQLADLKWKKEDGPVLSALKIIEPQLVSVTDNSIAGDPILVGDIGKPKLVPLSVMGEGMNQVVRIILKLVAAQGGVALIDEVENGIHYSVQSDVWAAIDKAAQEANLQVFAATHSLECVKAAHKSIGADRLMLHRLQKKGGEIRCVTYSPEEIQSVFEFNFEVR